VNSNRKALIALDAMLLERLTSSGGNLLDDDELVSVLHNTKTKAGEVKEKLTSADETKSSINEKREQFRPVATRGAVLYFSIVEISHANPMYQTSLEQFLQLFMQAMDRAEKSTLASKRVGNIIEAMTYLTYRYINRGLYEKDKLSFVMLMTMKVLLTAGLLGLHDFNFLLRGGAALDINSVRKKPFAWLTNEAWLNVIELSQVCKFFAALPGEMASNEAAWRRWYEDNQPEQLMIPEYERRIQDEDHVGPFYKLLLLRSLRLDRTILAAKDFIRHTPEMGLKYVEPVTDTIASIYAEMTSGTPVIFLLSTGADPTDSIEQLARKKKCPFPAIVSLGEGQEPVALKAMNTAAANGTWVLLQNCELGLGLMGTMEDVLLNLQNGMDDGFRLFITALPSDGFPLGLLQMSTKVTNEPPAGLQAGLLRSYTVIVDQDRLERVETKQWRQLLFNLCFLHSIVQERRKFGPLGWTIPYEFNTGDLLACVQFLQNHLDRGPISWPTLQYMVSEVQYGGKITDDIDRRMFMLYAKKWINEQALNADFSYTPPQPILPIPDEFDYRIPESLEIETYRKHCSSLPDVDSPEIFGLHPNADLTYRVKSVNSLIATMSATRPKGGGGDGGPSQESVVSERAAELLSKLPDDYVEEDYNGRLKKAGGLGVPLNICLYQEIQRLQKVIAKVKSMLTQMLLAIKGEVVMTLEMQRALNAIYTAHVPPSWTHTVSGDEFSWLLPTLGLWFMSLGSRDEQNRKWLNAGRPNSFWLTGFFNPQGFLTAMKQEVTRKHKANEWALDDMVYHSEVTSFDDSKAVRSAPAEGVYIHGLFVDGAGWSKVEGSIVESEPKKLFAPLPVLMVTAKTKQLALKDKKQMFDPLGPYECPCYKYPARTDRYLIFMVSLRTTKQEPLHWGLRGLALLCSTD